jgi:aspartyl-tRNA(Asn)/glutamyl-tRNA(Gln) amidotransferase subunit B
MLLDGQTPVQETRGWKDDLNKSVSQRTKEDAMDYRYFPEPDLPILRIEPIDIESLNHLPVLPGQQRQKYLDLGLAVQIANTLVSNDEAGRLFESVVS